MAKMNWGKTQHQSKMDKYYREVDCYARAKRTKQQTGPALDKNERHNRVMKLASRLYQRMKEEPDFAKINKKKLWEMAQEEAKRFCGCTP